MLKITFPTSAQIVAEVTQTLNAEVNKMATDLHRGLMAATPVDTGAARNGWQLQLGDEPVIENMVPYIGILNDGHSDQAPALFVEAEIARVCK